MLSSKTSEKVQYNVYCNQPKLELYSDPCAGFVQLYSSTQRSESVLHFYMYTTDRRVELFSGRNPSMVIK